MAHTAQASRIGAAGEHVDGSAERREQP
jgi:hypothetical protein